MTNVCSIHHHVKIYTSNMVNHNSQPFVNVNTCFIVVNKSQIEQRWKPYPLVLKHSYWGYWTLPFIICTWFTHYINILIFHSHVSLSEGIPLRHFQWPEAVHFVKTPLCFPSFRRRTLRTLHGRAMDGSMVLEMPRSWLHLVWKDAPYEHKCYCTVLYNINKYNINHIYIYKLE